MKKNSERILAGALSAVMLLGLTACGTTRSAAEQETAEVAPIPVETRLVTTGSVNANSTVSGTVASEEEYMVTVSVTAKCLETYVSAGDRVEEGQPLCRLDVSSTLSNFRAARLSLNSAQQSYSDQAAVFDRQINTLNDQIALLEQQVPLAEQAIPMAEQAIPLAEQAVAQVQEQLTVLDQQLALLEKNASDLKALQGIGAASQAEIDAAELQLSQVRMQKDAAQMQLNQAQVQVDQARLALDQARLQPDQVRMQVTQARLQLQSAQATRNNTLNQLSAGIETARSSVQQLELALENIDGDGNVVAPADGLLTTFSATKDNFVNTSSPVARISPEGKMEIRVSVSESLISKLASGDRADVSVPSLGKTFEAPVRSVEHTASAATKLYTVKLAVPESVTGVLSGMFADVTFHTDTAENAVMVPSEAVLNEGDVQFVYLAENGAAKRINVSTGRVNAGMTEVISGLSGGETLVTVGQTYLSDGAPLRVVKEG